MRLEWEMGGASVEGNPNSLNFFIVEQQKSGGAFP